MTEPWNPQPTDGPPVGYGSPPTGYPVAPTWAAGQDGPRGQVRSTGTCIVLTIVTLGIYTFVYNYKVHSEMQRHSGRGVGGGVALLLTFLAGVAMPFVTSAEVGSLYGRRGERGPVNAWTGLWAVLPNLVGSVVFFVTIVVAAVGSSSIVTDEYGSSVTTNEGAFGAALLVGFLLWFAGIIAGVVIWFVKTNSALNRYWETVPG